MMASEIDATKPADNTPPSKSEFRDNFRAAKEEIEDLQRRTSLAWNIALGNQPL